MVEDSLDTNEAPDTRPVEEGRFAGTWQNKAAGRALRAARVSLGPQRAKQVAFAATLSKELGVHVSPTTLSGWETGRRTVPGPVLIAAAAASQQSLDGVIGESGMEEVATWAETLGLPQRLEGQAAELQALKDELAVLRQQHAAFYTEVIQTLSRAGLPYPKQATRPGERRGAAGGERSGR